MSHKFMPLLGLLGGVLAGCGGGRVNLTSSGVVKTEILSTPRVHVSSLRVYGEEGRLVVSGNVKPDFRYTSRTEGHVDVVILAPDTTVVDRTSVSYAPRALFPPARGRRDSSFVARFPSVPPVGAVVRAGYHDGRLPAGVDVFDCGDNAAARGNKSRS